MPAPVRGRAYASRSASTSDRPVGLPELQAPQVVLHHGPAFGYTLSMKTAISLPDRVFREAERYAHRTKRTRSQLYSEALAEYLARHSPEEVTAAMNSVVDQVGPAVDRFASTAARRTLERTEW